MPTCHSLIRQQFFLHCNDSAQKSSGLNQRLNFFSQPFLPLEEPHESQHDGEAHAGYGWVAVAPVELGHIGEIHAVPAGEEGEGQKDGGNDGEHFHEVVLLNGKLGLVGVLHLADDGLQILHLAGVAIDAAVENGQAVQDFFRKQRIVVEQDVVKDAPARAARARWCPGRCRACRREWRSWWRRADLRSVRDGPCRREKAG